MSSPNIQHLIKRAITMRLAGATLSIISSETGLSVSTLYRTFKKNDVSRGGITAELVSEARKKLIHETTFIDNIKFMIASSISDDLELARQIREAVALSLEEVINDSRIPATIKSRSLASLSTALKLTQDVQRKALNVDKTDQANQINELPILTIRKMTNEEFLAIKNRAKNETEIEEEVS